MKGRGKLKEFLGKANNFLKKSQILIQIWRYDGTAVCTTRWTGGGCGCDCGLWTKETTTGWNWVETCGGKTWIWFVCSRRSHHMVSSRRPMT